MVQQISAVNVNTSSAGKPGPSSTQDTDEFRSMLKAAAADASSAGRTNTQREQDSDESGSMKKADGQERDSKAADKAGDGKKKEQTKKTDESDQDRTNTGQTQGSVLQPEGSILPNEAALFVSEENRQTLAKDSPAAGPGGSAQEHTAAAGISAVGTLPQSGAESKPEKEVQNSALSAQVLPPGEKTARETATATATAVQPSVQQAATAVTSQDVSTQAAQENGNTGQTAVPSDSDSAASPKSGSVRQALAIDSGSHMLEGQKSAGEQRTAQAAGTAGKTSSSAPDAADKTAQSSKAQGQAGTAQTRPEDPKNFGADGAAASSGGLSALYGNGKVVIRVSGETAQAQPSPARQVANAAAHQMQSGKTEFQMDLYPQSLGKVSVKLTSQNGLLTVEIAASDPKTQSLLASGSSEIRSILQASAGQNVQTVVPNQQAQQWYGQSQNGGGNSENRRQKREEPRKSKLSGIGSVSAELNTGDFLAMIQQIGAYAR